MQSPSTTKSRIRSIDLLRGIVMIIMALDHTRDFFHDEAFTGDPLDVENPNPFLFFTRWITHFCAPVFVFLSGVSAWLQSERKTTKELSLFLITRGLWLVILEIFVITFGILGDVTFSSIVLQTIWAIGVSMVILGVAIWLPFPAILALGTLLVFGHNLLDFAEANRSTAVPLWWNFLHQPTIFQLTPRISVGVFYPLMPWIGLMMLGYCCGKIFTSMDAGRRKNILLWLGIGSLVLFVVLRLINVYGDPVPWTRQSSATGTFFSFINVNKYPPSLQYLLIMIGVALIFLALVKERSTKLRDFLIVYGRVPLFYYILHFYLLKLISVIVFLSRGHSFSEGMQGVPNLPFKFLIPGEGYDLWVVYVIWIAIVLSLYPLCKWYDRYKTNHKEKKWLSYL